MGIAAAVEACKVSAGNDSCAGIQHGSKSTAVAVDACEVMVSARNASLEEDSNEVGAGKAKPDPTMSAVSFYSCVESKSIAAAVEACKVIAGNDSCAEIKHGSKSTAVAVDACEVSARNASLQEDSSEVGAGKATILIR